jgi:hypothetical protein
MVLEASGETGCSADRFLARNRHKLETSTLQGSPYAMTANNAALIDSDYSFPCPATIRHNILLKWKIVAGGFFRPSLDCEKLV